MQRGATFADLPVELGERIILLVAYQWAVEDKQSLARLARASRAIHALVRPILFDRVVVSARNVSKIRAVLHMFRSTRTLEVEPGLLDDAALVDFYACSSSFPNIDIFTGPLDALLILMPRGNPERIVTRDKFHFDALFTPERLDRGHFSRLMHLRIASKVGTLIVNTQLDSLASLRLTHIMLDLEHIVPCIVDTVSLLLGRLPMLQRLCLLVPSTTRYKRLRDTLESYLPLYRETRVWIATPPQANCLHPVDIEYWLVGEQVQYVS
ncbi:hypothetical protein EXIGLDRAFT_771516 [Exidia glandulosa HHB12029]|uniref:F-box domain-containing protein n=1 Tax=Exidia glandulosa HHB12029 TaxID=1314781 RepID=A0A165FXY7_EXIGL|nr:hypothetical protein EXIGLDRAFT_771516 [Exidia glandulosa HHB12029]